MARSRENLEIHIQTKVEKAKKDLASFGAALGGVLSVYAAFSAARRGLDFAISQASEAIKKANIQEQADRKLAIALKSLGKEAAGSFDEMKRFASELQRVTSVGDETTEGVIAMIAQLGRLQGQELKRTTKAAIDLSQAFGIDLKASALLLAKAAAGSTEALSRYGIIIDENIPKSEKFGAVLDSIEQKVGGFSEAITKTFVGASQQAANALGDFQEKIGDIIIKSPEVIAVLNNLTTLFADLTEVISSARLPTALAEFGEGLFRVTKWGAAAVTVFSAFNPTIQTFIPELTAALAAFTKFAEDTEGALSDLVDKRKELAALFKQADEQGVSPAVLTRINELMKALGLVKDNAEGAAEQAAYLGTQIERFTRFTADGPVEIVKIGAEEVTLMEELVTSTQMVAANWDLFLLGVDRTLAATKEQDDILQQISAAHQGLIDPSARLKKNWKDNEYAVAAASAALDGMVVGALTFSDALIDAAFGGKVAFGEMFKTLLKDIAKAIAEALILKAILAATGGAVGGGGGISLVSLHFKEGGLVRAASGGKITGGTRGVDSVPALLTPGEVVLPAGLVEDLERSLSVARNSPGGLTIVNEFNNVISRNVVEDFVQEQNRLAEHFGIEVVATRIAGQNGQ